MNENKKEADFHESERINIMNKNEVQYWIEKFGVTESVLLKAMSETGFMVKDVEREIIAMKKQFS